MVDGADILQHLRAAGVRVALLPDGHIETRGRVPVELAQHLRAHRAAVLDALRLETPEAAGELRACEREADDLRRLRTGLGVEVDGLLWQVLARLDKARAERCWRHVQRALADDLLSRLVGWTRSLSSASAEQVDALLAGGPRAHPYHDAEPRPAGRSADRA